MTFWPIVGTTILWVGRMEMAHARVMDARRGQPPAPVDHDRARKAEGAPDTRTT
jgi:hypothetical protein